MKKMMILFLMMGAMGLFFAACEEENTTPDWWTDVYTEPDVTPDTPADVPVDHPPDITTDTPIDNPPDITTDPDVPVEILPDTPGGSYGTLNANFSTPFILDGAREDTEYFQAHQDGIIMTESFTGTYGTGKNIPNAAVVTVSVGLHFAAEGTSPAAVGIFQDSYADTAGTTVANPVVRLFFPSDNVTTGACPLDLYSASGCQLYVVNITSATTACILALGQGGTINVTAATNTAQTDGGTISLNGSALPIWHPTNVEGADISSDLTAQGLTVCPIE
jgi:hypothetical protein